MLSGFSSSVQTTQTATTQQQSEYSNQRQIYIDNLRGRAEDIFNILSDTCPSLVCFTYELDTNNAQNRNIQTENSCIEYAKNNQREGTELLAKFQKAKEANPNPQICAVVAIRGINGIIERINAATTAHTKIQEGYAKIDEVNKVLYSNCTKLQTQLHNIKMRHIELAHQFLALLNLIEECALLSGNVETNVPRQLANIQTLNKIGEVYNYGKWQCRLNTLKYQIEALSDSFEYFCFPSHINERNNADTLNKYQEKAIYDILTETSTLINSQRESLDNINAMVKWAEQAIKENKTK